jgi:hypothetical protein
MAKTAILSGALRNRISRGDGPPHHPLLACGQRNGRRVTSDSGLAESVVVSGAPLGRVSRGDGLPCRPLLVCGQRNGRPGISDGRCDTAE